MRTPSISVLIIFIVFVLTFVLIIRFSKTYPSFFTIKKVIFSKTYPSFLTVKEGSTFLTKPLFNGLYTPFGSPVCGGQKPQGREDVTALRCSEPLRYKVGGPSKVCARFCGLGPPVSFISSQLAILFKILFCRNEKIQQKNIHF